MYKLNMRGLHRKIDLAHLCKINIVRFWLIDSKLPRHPVEFLARRNLICRVWGRDERGI
jgi:hypothetical protein